MNIRAGTGRSSGTARSERAGRVERKLLGWGFWCILRMYQCVFPTRETKLKCFSLGVPGSETEPFTGRFGFVITPFWEPANMVGAVTIGKPLPGSACFSAMKLRQ